MAVLYRKVWYCVTLLFLCSCADSPDVPPFNFHCRLKLEDTSRADKNNIDVFLFEPKSAEVVNLSFRYNEIDIQVQDRGVFLNQTIDYVIIVRFMQGNQNRNDIIKVKYHFNNAGLPNIKSAFYNAEKPIFMTNDIVVFNLFN